MKLMTLPKVLAPLTSTEKKSKDVGDFPMKYYSPSSMIKFATNQLLFKVKYLNGDRIDSANSIASIVGTAFHNAMEVYAGGVEEMKPSSEAQAIEFGLQTGMAFLESYPEGFINYTKNIPTRQKAIEMFVFGYNSYIKETPYRPDQLISTEEEIEEKIDVEWRGERLELPVPLKGRLDQAYREDDKLKIRDYKTCQKFTDLEKIDGKKIIQAVVYYLLMYARYGEAPYSVVFEEVKLTKNADGSDQVKRYEMVFEENELFFSFFFRMYECMTRALNGEMVYMPNLDTFYDNEVGIIIFIHRLDEPEERAKQMIKHQVSDITELLKKEIQSAGNMRKLLKTMEENFIEAKSMDYSTMTTELKIQNKMREHGIAIKYEDVINGASIDLYRFSPSMCLKMSKLKSFVTDIEQVLGISGVRILAPLPNSTMIGFEIPRAERTFPTVPGGNGFDVAIGQTVIGEPRRFDIRSAPHLLVAGASGSGKSVFLNALIDQLLRIKNADLYLYDPKMVELAQYKDRVSEYAHSPEEIMKGLLSLEEEMDDRYRKMSKAGVRNISETKMPYKFVIIDEFGDFIIQARDAQKRNESVSYYSKSRPWLIREASARGIDVHNREQITKDELAMLLEKSDESNPLLDVDVEKVLVRLASKARACGIHIILATQRPSVDIITGGIKANFPTKVIFKTSKEIDSRIVIDEAGAEKLLGKGDMLFVSDTGSERLQGYLS